MLRAAHTGRPAFEAQFLLTEEQLGSFWASLLPKLPRYEACKPWPNWLFQTVDGLSQIACFFSGEGSPAQLDALQNALNSHWRAYIGALIPFSSQIALRWRPQSVGGISQKMSGSAATC